MTSQRTNKPSAVEVLKLALVACLAAELLSPVVRGQEAADTCGGRNRASSVDDQLLRVTCSRYLPASAFVATGRKLTKRDCGWMTERSRRANSNRAIRAIVPERPDESELLRRVTADESERMPPEEPPLDAKQVATLRQWIAEGATWPDHWAYQPLSAAAPPRFDDAET